MSSPHQIVHNIRTEMIEREKAESLASLAQVMKYQAESARKSQRMAWLVSFASLLVAAGSLACAILTLTVAPR